VQYASAIDVVVVEAADRAVVVVSEGGGTTVVVVSGAAVLNVADVAPMVEAGAEVVVITGPLLPVTPLAVVVVTASFVCCIRRTVCDDGSDGAEFEARAPPTMPPTKPAPASAASEKLRRFLMNRSCV
jgi:hypothetical protein